MKNILRKFMGLVMCAALLAGMIPFDVRAEGQAVQKIVIKGITQPIEGEHPSFDIGLEPHDGCCIDTGYSGDGYINGMTVYDDTSGCYLTPDSVFIKGHKVMVYVMITAEPGYYFSIANTPNTELYIDGIDESLKKIIYDYNNGVFRRFLGYYAFTVGEEKKISRVDITETITKGTVLKEDTLHSDTAGVDQVSSVWSKDYSTLHAETVADHGVYDAVLTIKAKGKYRFSWDTSVNVFGQSRKVQTLSKDRMTITTMTGKVEIECDHSGDSSQWKHDDEGLEHYRICPECGGKHDEGEHSFGEPVQNGAEDVYTCTVCGYEKTVPNGAQPIDHLVLNDHAVYENNRPKDYTLYGFRGSGSIMATVEKVTFKRADDGTVVGDSERFVYGKEYLLELEIKAAGDYYFDNTVVECHSRLTKGSCYALSEIANDKKTMTAVFHYYAMFVGYADVSCPEIKTGMTYMDVLDGLSVRSYKQGSNVINDEMRNVTVTLSEGDDYDNMSSVFAVYHKTSGDGWYDAVYTDALKDQYLKDNRIRPEKNTSSG